jgi:hypothetical protein
MIATPVPGCELVDALLAELQQDRDFVQALAAELEDCVGDGVDGKTPSLFLR